MYTGLHQLPPSLWALIVSLALLPPAAAQSSLTLNNVLQLANTSSSSSSPLLLSLPSASSLLSVSIALCASASGSGLSFFVTNSSTVSTPGPGGGTDVFQLDLGDDGVGNWTGVMTESGKLAVYSLAATDSMQIAASDNGPLFEHFNGSDTDTFPLFGDSTSNQALLYSPPMGNGVRFADPTYPNYTLPSPQDPFSNASPPQTNYSYTLLLSPTAAGLPSRPQTACALTRAVNPRTNGTLASRQWWLRDAADGYRTEWLVNGLTPSTNYTMYTVLNGTKVAGPQYFVTKSGTFACPLVHSLPYCPSVSYAVPLPFPSRAAGGVYTSTSLPDEISSQLLSYLSNFTTSLTSFACGRDLYSPLKSCADCRRAYQKWLCSVSFPRCGEYPSVNTTGFALPSSVASQDSQAQATFRSSIPTAALSAVPSGTTPRNPTLPVFNQSYYSLLPCLETCADADRSCPYFIGFKCPAIQFNANESYGVGFVDGDMGGGEYRVGGGDPGVAQDVWGNVWCNMS